MSESSSTEGADELDVSGTVKTVAELNSDIATLIDRTNELEFDYVVGDVSSDSESNGTRYFDLVHDDATINCLVFSRTRKGLASFDEGDRVAVKGRLNYYEKRGNCSIFVDDVIPVGDSEYHQKIEQLREALDEEGLFDESAKRDLPYLPSHIGIVTAVGSDAEQDAINGIHDRHPSIDVSIHDSRVQGEAAAEEVCEAIAYFDAHREVDIIVVTRGGGSEQDLYTFSSEPVARMVASTDIPVVTAIGHENDRPVVDDVADARAMTPTEIGSVVTPEREQLAEHFASLRSRSDTAYNQTTQARLEALHTAAGTAYEQRVAYGVSGLENSLTAAYDQFSTGRVAQLRSDVDAEYEKHVLQSVGELRNGVDSAFTAFKQEKAHEEATADLKQKQRRYKVALAVLVLLLVLFILLFGLGVV